jgi:predicted deacylase
MARRPDFVIGGHTLVAPAAHAGRLSRCRALHQTPVTCRCTSCTGARRADLFVSAAVHGDEINGVEIIRRLLQPQLKTPARHPARVPIVNVYGFVRRSRYLPDRRDLNRSFPGSETGSMAGRLARPS